MARKNQSKRLTEQHKESHGEIGIFGAEAKEHDSLVCSVSKEIIKELKVEFPQLSFRYRPSISKKEINDALQKIDKELGQTLFLSNSSIKPDGGIVEVKDDNGEWRVVVVSEAKFQGKDIDNIKQGKLVGKNNNQDLMGNRKITDVRENLRARETARRKAENLCFVFLSKNLLNDGSAFLECVRKRGNRQ